MNENRTYGIYFGFVFVVGLVVGQLVFGTFHAGLLPWPAPARWALSTVYFLLTRSVIMVGAVLLLAGISWLWQHRQVEANIRPRGSTGVGALIFVPDISMFRYVWELVLFVLRVVAAVVLLTLLAVSPALVLMALAGMTSGILWLVLDTPLRLVPEAKPFAVLVTLLLTTGVFYVFHLLAKLKPHEALFKWLDRGDVGLMSRSDVRACIDKLASELTVSLGGAGLVRITESTVYTDWFNLTWLGSVTSYNVSVRPAAPGPDGLRYEPVMMLVLSCHGLVRKCDLEAEMLRQHSNVVKALREARMTPTSATARDTVDG